jgi:MinD superfamily P-loop ATPase
MKQLLILSGKGGTGKTTVASAFIKFANAEAYADCDVDAPNLHLVSGHHNALKRTDYFGMPKAKIDSEKCEDCGLCIKNCRFDAVIQNKKGEYSVDNFSCEGCGVCKAICPSDAINMQKFKAGDLMLYKNGSVFSTAQLKMGSGTSGMLVTEVKKQMKNEAKNAKMAIIDGSPGIGCPVIASISGVDMVLIVAEPSISGISDMERIIKTSRKFRTKLAVCVNKYDTNLKNTEKIELFCKNNNLPFAGRIPFDPDAVKAVNNAVSIAEFDCKSGRSAKIIFEETMKILLEDKR